MILNLSRFSRICTGKRNFYQCLLKHTMASIYGFETEEGIYQIKRRRPGDHAPPQPPPEILRYKQIDIYDVSNSELNAIQQLLTLHKLTNQLCSSGNVLKGYMENPVYKPSIVCLVPNDIGIDVTEKISKTAFRWTNDGALQTMSGEEYGLERMEGPHPVFMKGSNFVPVYKSFDQAVQNLTQVCHLEESELKNELLKSLITKPRIDDGTRKHPFIVVEGLDGTGKSTMTQNLGNYLKGEILGTPPASIKHIRKEFDNYPELLRRSYYAYSNYLAAVHIKELLAEKPVVLDRYWHSTTAYAIAKDAAFGISEHLPEKGDEWYEWPSDLMKPSAVIFLTTQEKERDHRMITTRDQLTEEEHEMRKSRTFRKRISEAYRRIGLKDRWVEVDTSGTQQESLNKAINGLKEIGVL